MIENYELHSSDEINGRDQSRLYLLSHIEGKKHKLLLLYSESQKFGTLQKIGDLELFRTFRTFFEIFFEFFF